ncbi:hypothetical protein EDB89DRAFT_1991282 [Lactarius sanguifluus]|nr:hypothetical protein EDB89DRAFT_1991282 [Lactarius sanguifluus]
MRTGWRGRCTYHTYRFISLYLACPFSLSSSFIPLEKYTVYKSLDLISSWVMFITRGTTIDCTLRWQYVKIAAGSENRVGAGRRAREPGYCSTWTVRPRRFRCKSRILAAHLSWLRKSGAPLHFLRAVSGPGAMVTRLPRPLQVAHSPVQSCLNTQF